MNEGPETMDGVAIMQHEVFMSYVRAGFTREEALELVTAHIKMVGYPG